MFRAVDREDLGVVSFNEALEILSNVRFFLKDDEIEAFRNKLDVDNTGMVNYEHFSDVGSQIVFGYFLKS